MHKLIRVGELAALHKLEEMLRILMLEQQATWKRENDSDRNEIIAERHVGYDPELFHTGLHYDTQRPPNPEEFTVGIKAQVERFKEELLLLQPPPQYDLPP